MHSFCALVVSRPNVRKHGELVAILLWTLAAVFTNSWSFLEKLSWCDHFCRENTTMSVKNTLPPQWVAQTIHKNTKCEIKKFKHIYIFVHFFGCTFFRKSVLRKSLHDRFSHCTVFRETRGVLLKSVVFILISNQT